MAGASFFTSAANCAERFLRAVALVVARACESSKSALLLVYNERFSPGSLRCDECQNANRSSSRPTTSPKRSASYCRGRKTVVLRSEREYTCTFTFTPSFFHASASACAVATSCGESAVERVNPSTCFFLFVHVLEVALYVQPPFTRTACAAATVSSVNALCTRVLDALTFCGAPPMSPDGMGESSPAP